MALKKTKIAAAVAVSLVAFGVWKANQSTPADPYTDSLTVESQDPGHGGGGDATPEIFGDPQRVAQELEGCVDVTPGGSITYTHAELGVENTFDTSEAFDPGTLRAIEEAIVCGPEAPTGQHEGTHAIGIDVDTNTVYISGDPEQYKAPPEAIEAIANLQPGETVGGPEAQGKQWGGNMPNSVTTSDNRTIELGK